MRRGGSIALLAILFASVVAPLALAGAVSVPACCRVGGQHHCMATGGLDGFHAAPARCPYRSNPAITSTVASLLRSGVQFSFTVEQPKAQVPGADRSILEAFGDLHKRGPPSPFLFSFFG